MLRPRHTVRIPGTDAFITRPPARVVALQPDKMLCEAAKAGQAAGGAQPDTDGQNNDDGAGTTAQSLSLALRSE